MYIIWILLGCITIEADKSPDDSAAAVDESAPSDDTGGSDDTGSAGGSVADCAGDYGGTYTGDDYGSVAATLSEGGVLAITFVSDGAGFPIEGVAQIDPAGAIAGESQGVRIEGELDLSTCDADGRWYSGALNGDWELTPR